MTTSHAETRAKLEHERTHLVARIDELTVGGDVDLEFDREFADRGQTTGEQTENRSLADTLQAELDDVERALSRMDDGSYGTCAVCGEHVSPERMEARLATDRCITHAL